MLQGENLPADHNGGFAGSGGVFVPEFWILDYLFGGGRRPRQATGGNIPLTVHCVFHKSRAASFTP